MECRHLIWDPNKKKLFLSRDPFGEKPLLFSLLKNSFFVWI